MVQYQKSLKLSWLITKKEYDYQSLQDIHDIAYELKTQNVSPKKILVSVIALMALIHLLDLGVSVFIYCLYRKKLQIFHIHQNNFLQLRVLYGLSIFLYTCIYITIYWTIITEGQNT